MCPLGSWGVSGEYKGSLHTPVKQQQPCPPLVPLEKYLSCGDDLRLLHALLNRVLDDFGDRKYVSREGTTFKLSAPTNAVYEAAWELMLWNCSAPGEVRTTSLSSRHHRARVHWSPTRRL